MSYKVTVRNMSGDSTFEVDDVASAIAAGQQAFDGGASAVSIHAPDGRAYSLGQFRDQFGSDEG